MKTDVIDISVTERQLVVEVPPDVVETEIGRVTQAYARKARIPGFRPGKAPARVVRQRFKDEILHDVVHDLVPRLVDDALRERTLEPVDTPSVRDVSISEGQPLTFKADFEILPPIEPVDCAAISLRRDPVAVADEAVDRTLERLRERAARFEPIDGRPAAHGDFISGDLVRRVRTAPAVHDAGPTPGSRVQSPEETHEGITIEIGASVNPPGFDAALIGLEPGATKSFAVTFPADYPVEDLRNAEVEYTVAVKGLKRKVLPSLDDEFARDLGEFDSLAALRDRVKGDLLKDAERSQEREVRNDLLRQLASRASIDPPKALVAREVDRRLEEFVGQLIAQRVDPTRAGIDWAEFRESQQDAARETVKAMLVLDDVARREALTVSDEEVEAELQRLADRTGKSVAAIRARLEKDGDVGRVQAGLRREKAVAFVLSRATIAGV